MPDSGTTRKYDGSLTSYLLFLLVFCVLPVFFSAKDGTGVMFYAGFPMLFAAASSAACLVGSCDFVSSQTDRYISRHMYSAASSVCRMSLKCALLQTGISFLLFYAGRGLVGKTILGNSFIAEVLRFYAPALMALPLVGVCKGFLHGIGMEWQARASLYLMSGIFAAGGLIFGILGAQKGAKVGKLLRNDDMGYVYSACGLGTGLSIAVLGILIFLGVFTFANIRRIQRSQQYRKEDLFRNADTMKSGELFRCCLRHIFGSMGPSVVLSLGMIIGYRLWYGTQEDHANTIVSMWGGFIGIGFPICVGLGLVAAMPFTYLAAQVIFASNSGKKKLCRIRLGMLLRLSAYVGIPLSAFVFSAAKEVVAMFPELTFKAEETAILSLKAGSPLIFLIQTSSLVLVIYWRCSNRRMVVIGGCAAFFVQVVAQVVMQLLGVGITMNLWPSVIMGSVFLIFLYCAGRHSVTAGVDNGWMMDDLLIFICAVIASIPVILLNDYLVLVLPGVAAFTLAAVIYLVVYVLFSILLHAADLRNIHRIPFGGWIRELAVLLGAAEEDDA